MTTRTMPETHEARCRELAELWTTITDRHEGWQIVRTRKVPNPLFDSLRGEHDWYKDALYPDGICLRCEQMVPEPSYCLLIDNSAMDATLEACWIAPFAASPEAKSIVLWAVAVEAGVTA